MTEDMDRAPSKEEVVCGVDEHGNISYMIDGESIDERAARMRFQHAIMWSRRVGWVRGVGIGIIIGAALATFVFVVTMG